jgi:tetratricopeptide (TPR) repeat protein
LRDGAVADELDTHLADCASCRQVVAALAVATLPRLLASGSAPTVPAGSEPRSATVLLAGERVGRYLIDRLLGAGGMGLVYSARDPELDRAIALKLLRPALDADPAAARQQLVAEGQAMARLRHPNVTVVHDVGDHGGEVFIAMELVEGETLRAYLARPHAQRDVVRALVAAGRGLAAAHAAGLVHRDFKPENVLVGRDGRVCVSDFGLARATGSGDAAVAGTPAYMAPEQLDGADPDPRADQYSFCITAHEALAGRRPAATVAPRAMPRAIRRAIERGLATDPAARHASMDVLVGELEHALGARRRAALWAAGAVAAAGVATALLVARGHDVDPCANAAELPSSTWSASRADALRAAFVATHATSADLAGQRVVARLDAWAAEWADARREACVAARVRGAESVELLDMRMACLDQASHRVAALVDALAHASAADIDQAILATDTATDLAACTGARALLEPWRVPADPALRTEAEALRAQLAKAHTDGDLAHYADSLATASAVADRAAAHALRGVEAEAARLVAEAQLAIGDRPGARASLDRAIVAAEAADHAPLRVLSYCGLARIEGIAGNADAADRLARQARAIVDRLGDPALAVEVLDAEAHVAFFRRDAAHAAQLAHDTVAAYRKLHPDDMRAASLLEFEGVALGQAAKPADARARFEEELALRERLAGRDSPTLITVLTMLGNDARERGKLDDALAIFQRASAIVEASHLTSPAALGLDAQLASVLSQAGKSREALALINAVIPKLRQYMPDAVELQANLTTMRGEIEDDAGDPKAALADLAAARELLAKRSTAPSPDLATILEDEGGVDLHLARWSDAKTAYERALAIRTQLGGPDSPDLADCEAGLGEVALAQHDPAAAIAHVERALALRSGPDADPTNVAVMRLELARSLAAAHRDPARATQLLRDARAAFVTAGDQKHIDAIDAFLRGR